MAEPGGGEGADKASEIRSTSHAPDHQVGLDTVLL
jgi:hypothetical protein